ncbi:MAG: UDP-N-acetylmuramate dehydrogenase [Atopobiaceae bacterium]|nr:UDP-N-acetylmuramate dehydrogenase [Atopobiaceae bacterium]MCI2173385.1 UDP-N-acetylmuramate dehydrogenase [Atopobiaceae bacterium]MCI2207380.1 UDP-N-acetylmuramate dehydrogenase [Atopobiaceae bacterium]
MSLFNAYVTLSGAVDADISRDERMAHRTTYRIGGPASMVAVCHTYAALVKVLDVLHEEGVEWVVMGKGSNVLVSDAGFEGCVIVLGREFSRITLGDDGLVTAGAGVILSKLVTFALSNSLAGLEFACGIPGTLGGAISMDAGTRHEWIGQRLSDVVVLRPGEGLHRYPASEVEWGYRRTSIPTSEIVLEATLRLEPQDKARIASEMDQRLARRRRTQPMGKPSCGSVFRNPGTESVAKMLDECGLKGYSVGGASVSDTHANFIVNNGDATARDVIAVMGHMHDEVLEKRGVDLQPEVKFLGFSS